MQLGVHDANVSHPDWADRLEERLTATARVADQRGATWFTVMDPTEVCERVLPRLQQL